MSLRFKTILGIALIEIVFLSLLLWLSLDALRTTNEDQLRGRAHSTAHLLGIAIKNALIANDLATLEALAREAVSHAHEREVQFDLERQGISHFEEVHRVVILDPLGSVLIDSGRLAGGNERAAPPPGLPPDVGGLIHSQMPVEQSGQIFGSVRVTLSAARIQDWRRS